MFLYVILVLRDQLTDPFSENKINCSELNLLVSIKEEDEETGTEKPRETEEQNNRKINNIAALPIASPSLPFYS